MAYADAAWTYDELVDQVHRVAGGLSRMGVRQGDRVALLLPNCPEFVITFLAVQTIGAVAVNAGPVLGADDLNRLIGMTRPRLVVALDLLAARIDAANAPGDSRRWLWVSLQEYQPVLRRMGYWFKRWQIRQQLATPNCPFTWDELLHGAPEVLPCRAEPDDVAVLQPTGGTSGRLKIAQLSHRNLLTNATQLAAWVGLQQGQGATLSMLPMFHVYGLMTGVIAPVLTATMTLPMTRFELATLLDLITRFRPAIIPLVPAVFEALCDELERHPNPSAIESLRQACVTSGAAPLAPVTAQRYERLVNSRIVEGYGLTEASPGTHLNPVAAPREGSIGLPLPDTRARIADLNDPQKDAPSGEAGELWIAGPQVFSGYFGDVDEANRALVTDEQGTKWLRTGDVAHVDDHGFFHIVDRLKDMINHGGMKVWPAKVEALLRQHPMVADVAVVGRPDPVYTESVVAIVLPKPGSKPNGTTDAELKAYCRQHLAAYEVPSVFEIAGELPRTALGKLQRYRLQTPREQEQAHEAGKAEKADETDVKDDPGT